MKILARVCGVQLAAACMVPGALADSFWCGSALVHEGMAAEELVTRCGTPASREVVQEPIMARRPNGTTFQTGVREVEHWIYDRGSQQFRAYVTVEDGIAKTIELRPGS